MFSGIIQSTGRVSDIDSSSKGTTLTIHAPERISGLSIGASVAVDGVCLTVTAFDAETISFFVMPETMRKTTLESFVIGQRVNVENSLRLGDEIGGHQVYGHVDGTGRVISRIRDGLAELFTLELPPTLMQYIVPQGAIALNGVSLTVARFVPENHQITISLLEHTWTVTNLGDLNPGDIVNVEAEMILKYVHQTLHHYTK